MQTIESPLLCHLANVVLRGVKAQGSDREPQKNKGSASAKM